MVRIQSANWLHQSESVSRSQIWSFLCHSKNKLTNNHLSLTKIEFHGKFHPLRNTQVLLSPELVLQSGELVVAEDRASLASAERSDCDRVGGGRGSVI